MAKRVTAAFGTVVRPLQAFFRLEAASGILLFAGAAAALLWVNLGGEASYQRIFETTLSLGIGDSQIRFSLRELVNDGLMTIFFFVVGMEIKRELVVGELASVRRAVLPLIAALGGMIVPSVIYAAWNAGGPGAAGWGIPMATDIAFTIGALTLMRRRVSQALIVFITALAIFDDIGGILVIALFYGHGLDLVWLAISGGVTLLLFGMNRWGVISALAYALAGAALWFALHHSGIHATISGVVLGLMIPVRARRPARDVLRELADYAARLVNRPSDAELDDAEVLMIDEKLEDLQAPLGRFVSALHPLVAFIIMPGFALANSGVAVSGMPSSALTGPVALGAGVGLFVGKQIGIFLFTAVSVRLRLAPMPGGSSYLKLYGVSVVAGIGFTVALFIAALAFPGHAELLDQAKVGILAGSLLAGLVGVGILRCTRPI